MITDTIRRITTYHRNVTCNTQLKEIFNAIRRKTTYHRVLLSFSRRALKMIIDTIRRITTYHRVLRVIREGYQ